ncbi:MAG: peptide-methionine (S)-S-oxide reductase MsrA [Pseudomonadales bacterium]|nr:peptide-methionine (S)-S-oxide reductase MsrA [Pseudomonadales bacterium]
MSEPQSMFVTIIVLTGLCLRVGWAGMIVFNRLNKGNAMYVRILGVLFAQFLMLSSVNVRADTAIFAGGCFWCVEALYQELDGVSSAVSGFTGGKMVNPTYQGNHRGHYEAVEVVYDPNVISYQKLLEIFWVNIDPFDNRGQFCDKGPSYRSAVFVDSDQQRSVVELARQALENQFGSRVYTEVLPVSTFYPVEDYHQDYYKKNPLRYKFYRHGCGRDNRLSELWGDAAGH